jgi:hypothetical protein
VTNCWHAAANAASGPSACRSRHKPIVARSSHAFAACACATAQDALGTSVNGSEIWVSEGVYRPATSANRSATFLLNKGNVALHGGFAGTETSRDERDWQKYRTVLSGDLGGDDATDACGVVLDWSDIVTGTTNNVYNVVKAESVSGVVLDGFTITGGYNDISGWDVGAGLFPTYNNLTLRNLVFRGNLANGAGGAIYFYEGTGRAP